MPVTLHLIDAGPPPQFFLVGSALATACCCGEGDFPGSGWYCIQTWVGEDCESLTCSGAACQEITTEAQWNALDIGGCNYDDGVGMYVMLVAAYGPDTEVNCEAACECPS